MGKITATKEVLGELEIYLYHAGENYRLHGYKFSAARTDKVLRQIHDALSASGE